MSNPTWNTRDEITFIEELYRTSPQRFEGYVRALATRDKWGHLDRWAIVGRITQLKEASE